MPYLGCRGVLKKRLRVNRKICQTLFIGLVTCGLIFSSAPGNGFAADKPAEADLAAPPPVTDTNSDAVLRSYLQLQEQLHTALLAIEQTKLQADEAAKKNAEMISAKLTLIEQALTIQQERDSDALKKFNKATVTIAGVLGATGLLALILTIAFLFRAMKRLGQVAAGVPAALTMGQTHMLTEGGSAFAGAELPGGHRLLAALDKLEKRIQEMEAKNPMARQGSNGNVQGSHRNNQDENGNHFDESVMAAPDERAEQIALLLGKGQALMHMDKAESAVECFDEVIALDSKNSEALVKKGTALEKLKRLEDAIKCYDQAIAANNGMTLAYLYKGGVFNQMEKFSEALECYEQALKSQQKPVMS